MKFMNEPVDTSPVKPSFRTQLSWIPGFFLKPRPRFAELNAQGGGLWFVPMLVLSLTALIYVVTSGWVRMHLAAMGEVPLPADWQYWTPDMQNQYMQAQQATQGPVFLYVIPALGALASLWLLWVFVGSLLRLTLTLLGGHNSGVAMNVAAWAALPFGLRDILRAGYVLIAQNSITSAGLSGFIQASQDISAQFFQQMLVFADLFTVWYLVLLILGVRTGNSISVGRAILAVLLVFIIVFGARAAVSLLATRFGGLMITRPFF
jgi:hypothetical protein